MHVGTVAAGRIGFAVACRAVHSCVPVALGRACAGALAVAHGRAVQRAGAAPDVRAHGGARADADADAVASALGRAGVKVDASAIEMAEMTELGSAVAELTLHEQVFTSVKVTVKRSPITISYD